MDAGDEDIQYLENRPGGKAALLSRVGGIPLAVSIGYLSSRPALRFDEGTDDLPAYTETYSQRQKDTTRQVAQGKSKNETEIKQAPVTRPTGPATADATDINAQIATAMAQAQEGLSPEMAEQVNAALAQVQQEMKTAGMTGIPAAEIARTGKDTDTTAGSFSMTVMDAFKISGRGVVLTGRVDMGRINVGDTVCLETAKTGQRILKVESIENKRASADSASAGDMPGILVKGVEVKDISSNDQLRSACK